MWEYAVSSSVTEPDPVTTEVEGKSTQMAAAGPYGLPKHAHKVLHRVTDGGRVGFILNRVSCYRV